MKTQEETVEIFDQVLEEEFAKSPRVKMSDFLYRFAPYCNDPKDFDAFVNLYRDRLQSGHLWETSSLDSEFERGNPNETEHDKLTRFARTVQERSEKIDEEEDGWWLEEQP